MTLRRTLVVLNKRILGMLLSPEAARVVDLPPSKGGFDSLRGRDHCLIVTYRKDGTPVAQPVWPGYGQDRIYVWTEEQAYKARRLRANANALIAPCDFRGRPLGPPIKALGRVLPPGAESELARTVIQASWGWKRRIYERATRPITGVVYLEFTPVGAAGRIHAQE